MQQQFDNEVLYYTFPEFEQYDDIVHAFSSREGGVSKGFYRTMNLGIIQKTVWKTYWRITKFSVTPYM